MRFLFGIPYSDYEISIVYIISVGKIQKKKRNELFIYITKSDHIQLNFAHFENVWTKTRERRYNIWSQIFQVSLSLKNEKKTNAHTAQKQNPLDTIEQWPCLVICE